MQHITVVAVGKAAQFYAEGVREYARRLAPLCRFEVVEIAEEALDEKNAPQGVVKAALDKEGARILAAVPKGARLVALCVEGRQMTSEDFAAYLNDAAGSGRGAVAFAIGSSHGLADAVKAGAELRLSFSKMTMPHQMARLVLTEQIYRAFMIRQKSRYHK